METLVGTVDHLVFSNKESGFSIFVIHTTSTQKEAITVRGHVSTLQPGQPITLQGTWTIHPKFGRQFVAEHCTIESPKSTSGLKKFLASGAIKGIGKVYAEKLVNFFGTEILDVIEHEPNRLARIPGVGPKRISTIINAWKDQKEIANIMVFLQDKDVSPAFATKIYKKYGANTIAIITENPYRIAEDIWGIGFKTADQIAQRIGIEPHEKKRIKAGIIFAITQHTARGHLYIDLEELKIQTHALLNLNDYEIFDTIKIALHELYDQQTIVLVSIDNTHYITLSQYYYSEKGVAQKIERLLKHSSSLSLDTQQIYRQLRTNKYGPVTLNDIQQQGIMSCLAHKITVITGGPGTGKTTIIKQLITILEQSHISYKLAAPTGRAAKRIHESTGRHAMTLHRLLEFNVQTMSFSYNEQRALKTNILIIDEASMLDIFLVHAVLRAVPLHAHIIFIGDVDQLPSVGAGNFLHDLIASAIVPVTRLKHIFRQAQNSLIVYNAHQINKGEFPQSQTPDTIQDYLFIKEPDPARLIQHIKRLFHITLPKNGIRTSYTIVLSPMHKGVAGTQALNIQIQRLLNPQSSQTIQRMGYTYSIGDRVIQMKNNYDKNVFNGDIGVIREINLSEQTFVVHYPEQTIVYDNTDLYELSLAYAISIHKSQGSEFDAVIIPLFTQHFTLLQRNLIYTALTRAKRFCIIIGQPKALAIALKNNKGSERNTLLKRFMTEDIECR